MLQTFINVGIDRYTRWYTMTCVLTCKIKPDVKEELDQIKIHPRQSYSDIISELIIVYKKYQYEIEQNKDG